MSRTKVVGPPVYQRVLVMANAFVGIVAATVSAQRFRLPEGYQVPPRFPPAGFSDGAFTHVKIMYESVRREAHGMGWSTDYPFAGIHLTIRVSELATTPTSRLLHAVFASWVRARSKCRSLCAVAVMGRRVLDDEPCAGPA